MADPDPSPDFLLCFSRFFLWRLALVAGVILLALYAGRVLLVVFAGILIAVVLRALADLFSRLPFVKPSWSYPIVLCSILAATAIAAYALGPRVVTQAHDIVKSVPGSLASLQAQLNNYVWGRDVLRLLGSPALRQQISRIAGGYAASTVEILTEAVIILVTAMFLGAKPKLYRNGVLQLLPAAHRAVGTKLLDDIGWVLRHWMLGQLVPMLTLGFGTFIGLSLLRVPLAFTLSLFTSLMLFVPYIGSVVAYAPTAMIALTQGPTELLYVSFVYLGVHIAEGYVVTPLSQRHAIHLPPALTLISQFFMWKVAGLLGVLIATPIAAVIVVAVQTLYLKRDARANR